ncbi:response regulator [Sulfitobacter sp. BDSS02]|nr:response regulator [Sulfitobacter sp. BDSS02]MBR9851111.1 response regulator [Paracoccaceae bacterium]
MKQNIQEIETVTVKAPCSEPGIKALILDDSVFDRRRIRRLSDDTALGITLDETASIEGLQEALDQERFDVILIDYNLPQGNGIEALQVIRNHQVNGSCPTIMVTGDDKSDVAVKSLKMGCEDYLTKDEMTPETLKSSIVGAIKSAAKNTGIDALVQSEIEQVTSVIMAKYTNALQPKLARVIRDMRSLRSALPDKDVNVPGELENIERQCIKLWSLLLDPHTVSRRQEFRH